MATTIEQHYDIFERYGFVKHITEIVSHSFDINLILTLSAKEIVRFINVDHCLIILHNKGEGKTQPQLFGQFCQTYDIDPIREKDIPLHIFQQINQDCDRRFPMVVFNTSSPNNMPEALKAYAQQYNIQSLLSLEILYRGLPYGHIILQQCGYQRNWRNEELDLLENITTQLGVALYQAELYEKEQKAQQELLKKEERYRLVIQGSNDGVWDWDILTDETFWNDRLYQILGLQRDKAPPVTDMFWELCHEADRERVNKALYDHLNGKTRLFHEEFRLRHSSGTYRYCLSKGEAQRDKNGQAIRMAGMMTDISEHKDLETKLADSRNQLEIANSRKDQFLANMSHEFRTPLNAIIGFSEMILSGMANTCEKQARYAENIAISGKHLLNMVNDLLDIARIETGQIHLFPETVPLESIVQEVYEVVKEPAAQKNITIQYEVKRDVRLVYADTARLRQIFYNLISNAIKFNRPGGSIFIRVFKTGDREEIICEVEDTGIGISNENIGKLFSQFYQVDSSYSRTGEGTGLGLTLTKKLVELHGGQIAVQSKAGVGSVFTFTLPNELLLL